MENLGLSQFWCGRRVLITGHTGFKGSWLSLWLLQLGAKVYGLALEPLDIPNLFDQLELSSRLDHFICDIRDIEGVESRIQEVKPDIIFHLAAQPLVLQSYKEPMYTWQVNLMGGVNLLEILRAYSKQCVVVMVTTDKVYKNSRKKQFFCEEDNLGGIDPYSSSKAAFEIAIESWKKSFFDQNNENKIRIGVARAGNVIGGGDWGTDRLIPDIVRSILVNEKVIIRNPDSVRPWQHVLDALIGYLRLAELLHGNDYKKYMDAWNFGPKPSEIRCVRDVIQSFQDNWSLKWCQSTSNAVERFPENDFLALSINKAKTELDFSPRWNFNESILNTIEWYQYVTSGGNAYKKTVQQISDFNSL